MYSGIKMPGGETQSIEIMDVVRKKVEDVLFLNNNESLLKKRTPQLTEARFIMWYILRVKLKFKFKQIADYFGKDHATIIHGVDVCRDLLYVKDVIFTKKFVSCINELPTIIQYYSTSVQNRAA